MNTRRTDKNDFISLLEYTGIQALIKTINSQNKVYIIKNNKSMLIITGGKPKW